jgi:hypothetical protein
MLRKNCELVLAEKVLNRKTLLQRSPSDQRFSFDGVKTMEILHFDAITLEGLFVFQ